MLSAHMEDNSMYYGLVYFPQLDPELRELIDEIRRKYDPTVNRSKPHITVMFPVPDSVGEPQLISHIQRVLREYSPFEIRFGGFHKSDDHWLFLKLTEGQAQIKQLYQSLYTGILEKFRGDDTAMKKFEPHLGLGLFLKKGSLYDWDHPQEADFDQQAYKDALQQAKNLPLSSSYVVDKLNLMAIPDEVLDWATGKRANIPRDTQFTEVREFPLARS
jgi:2'-5' RNA ligase